MVILSGRRTSANRMPAASPKSAGASPWFSWLPRSGWKRPSACCWLRTTASRKLPGDAAFPLRNISAGSFINSLAKRPASSGRANNPLRKKRTVEALKHRSLLPSSARAANNPLLPGAFYTPKAAAQNCRDGQDQIPAFFRQKTRPSAGSQAKPGAWAALAPFLRFESC